jgi:thioredoxin-dependent peroxiredoxin
MRLCIGDEAPDFTAVCTTELGYMATLKPEFDKRNTKIVGLSIDPVSDHARRAKDIEETQGRAVNYPMTTGRNFDEVLRVLDSLQLTAKHKVATPVNRKSGEDVIIAGSVNDEEAKVKYPGGWKAPKPHLRIIPQPK